MTDGRKAEVGAGQRRVGVRVAHVAFLGGLDVDGHRPAGDAAEQVEDVAKGHARPSADIVDAPRHSADGGGGGGGGGVGHEREVAGLQAVAELDQRPAGLERALKKRWKPMSGR